MLVQHTYNTHHKLGFISFITLTFKGVARIESKRRQKSVLGYYKLFIRQLCTYGYIRTCVLLYISINEVSIATGRPVSMDTITLLLTPIDGSFRVRNLIKVF